MDWPAVCECRNADTLKAHQDISEPEEKDNRVILIVTKIFVVVGNYSESSSSSGICMQSVGVCFGRGKVCTVIFFFFLL